jgi:hypothetical protein
MKVLATDAAGFASTGSTRVRARWRKINRRCARCVRGLEVLSSQ